MYGCHSSSSSTSGAHQPRLALATLPSSTRSWPASSARSELGQHGVVEADDAGERGPPGAQVLQQVAADLGLDAAGDPARGAQLAEGVDRGRSSSHPLDSTPQQKGAPPTLAHSVMACHGECMTRPIASPPRVLRAATLAGLCLALALPPVAGAPASEPTDARGAGAESAAQAAPALQVTTVQAGLELPWDLSFLPNGAMLYTERDRRQVVLRAPNGTPPRRRRRARPCLVVGRDRDDGRAR
jgi:hypothetical protein